jgi:hypothetical protein
MGVVPGVDENEIRLNSADHLLDALDAMAIQGNGGVRILSPMQSGNSEDLCGRFLFLASNQAVVSAPAAIGHDEDAHVVAPARVLGKRPTAAKLDVVGMRTDR